jgi:hypothetical protein
MLPAVTGAVAEYPTLSVQTLSTDLLARIGEWFSARLGAGVDRRSVSDGPGAGQRQRPEVLAADSGYSFPRLRYWSGRDTCGR